MKYSILLAALLLTACASTGPRKPVKPITDDKYMRCQLDPSEEGCCQLNSACRSYDPYTLPGRI